jgi:hypothetical protein
VRGRDKATARTSAAVIMVKRYWRDGRRVHEAGSLLR